MNRRLWKRILMLADFVEKVKEERFDYHSWAGYEWAGDPKLSCGTTACALGWATTIPFFRRLGLHLVNTEDLGPWPYVGRKKSGKALGELFGVNEYVYQALFIPDCPDGIDTWDGDPTAKEWAEHARGIVDRLRKGWKGEEVED